ncbi:hypothetical protein CBR_g55421 [Chara braunii]|uniref:Uncharacterized protein n=1 Tax=Chara braunii TaxID=69332 RepID=A0A388K7Q7_CHABU|nr:hypothetical protein CBR_g55421 [Chara braunii]|eukprot:GBG66078.1 hypothetical protein CBR_g55421 [Chara braunii]
MCIVIVILASAHLTLKCTHTHTCGLSGYWFYTVRELLDMVRGNLPGLAENHHQQGGGWDGKMTKSNLHMALLSLDQLSTLNNCGKDCSFSSYASDEMLSHMPDLPRTSRCMHDVDAGRDFAEAEGYLAMLQVFECCHPDAEETRLAASILAGFASGLSVVPWQPDLSNQELPETLEYNVESDGDPITANEVALPFDTQSIRESAVSAISAFAEAASDIHGTTSHHTQVSHIPRSARTPTDYCERIMLQSEIQSMCSSIICTVVNRPEQSAIVTVVPSHDPSDVSIMVCPPSSGEIYDDGHVLDNHPHHEENERVHDYQLEPNSDQITTEDPPDHPVSADGLRAVHGRSNAALPNTLTRDTHPEESTQSVDVSREIGVDDHLLDNLPRPQERETVADYLSYQDVYHAGSVATFSNAFTTLHPVGWLVQGAVPDFSSCRLVKAVKAVFKQEIVLNVVLRCAAGDFRLSDIAVSDAVRALASVWVPRPIHWHRLNRGFMGDSASGSLAPLNMISDLPNREEIQQRLRDLVSRCCDRGPLLLSAFSKLHLAKICIAQGIRDTDPKAAEVLLQCLSYWRRAVGPRELDWFACEAIETLRGLLASSNCRDLITAQVWASPGGTECLRLMLTGDINCIRSARFFARATSFDSHVLRHTKEDQDGKHSSSEHTARVSRCMASATGLLSDLLRSESPARPHLPRPWSDLTSILKSLG